MENKFTPELIEKAKSAKTPEELMALAKENGVELTEESAAAYFDRLHPQTGELSDDELDNVSAGCYESGDTPKFSVGQHVGVCAGRGHAPARILSVSDEKHDGWCKNKQWIYSIKFDQGGEIRNDVYEDNIIEWND